MSVLSLMGYGGYESVFTNKNARPDIKIPIVTLSITFAIFMVMVLATYLFLLKKE
jgi:hypothetical protein